MPTNRPGNGFTLVELLVAMTVTLIITGAVVGLLTGGQAAFRREPEVADLQQNLRSAMDIIMRDVSGAGGGVPTTITRPGNTAVSGVWIQVFTRGYNSSGALDRPQGGGEQTDALAFFTSNSDCGAESVCGYDEAAGELFTDNNYSCVKDNSIPIFVITDGTGRQTWTARQVTLTPNESGCASGNHAKISFPAGGGSAEINAANDLCNAATVVGTARGLATCEPAAMLAGAEVIDYRITLGADGVPNLERRSSASLSGTWPNSFQVIARGIEDLQVEYQISGDPAVWPAPSTLRWVVEPPEIVVNNYHTLVRAVRVTLAGRTGIGTGLSGVSQDAAGGQFVRSSLTSTAAVRTALQHASQQFFGSATQPTWN